MDAFKRAAKGLDAEMHRQLDLTYGAMGLTLRRYWGYGTKRIRKIFDASEQIWLECSETNRRSMLSMLEDETGIEIGIPETSKSWHDLAYLNGEILMDPHRMTPAQIVYMRGQQKLWIGAMVTACLLLALHRSEGFGFERLQRISGQLQEVRAEYGGKADAIKKACREETGVEVKR